MRTLDKTPSNRCVHLKKTTQLIMVLHGTVLYLHTQHRILTNPVKDCIMASCRLELHVHINNIMLPW